MFEEKSSRVPVRLLSLAVALALYSFSHTPALASEEDSDELLAFTALRHGAQPKTVQAVPAKPMPVPSVSVPVPVPVPVPASPSVPAPALPIARATATNSLQGTSPVLRASHDSALARPVVAASPPVVSPAVKPLPPRPEPSVRPEVAAPVIKTPVDTTVADKKAAAPMGVSALSLGLNTARPAQAKSSPAELKNAVPESEIRALFSQAVLQALHINPKINSSRLQAEAAQSSIDEAKGQRWPQLNVSSNSRSLNFGSGYRRDNGNDDPVSLSVNVATTLYDFGQTSHTIKTREAQAEAATLTVSAESESTAWDVSSALTELSKQRLLIAISEDYVARMKELTKMLQGIVAVDQGRQSELTQAKGRLLSAESQLDAAVAKSRDTEIVLTRLLGESSISLPSASQWRLRLPDPQSQLSKVETHPTVLKAIADKQAAESEAAVVRASGLPTFSWVVSKNTGQDELGRRQAYETGIQMSWGLFRGGSTRAAERAALARAEASRYLVEDQQRDLEQRIRAANQDASSLLERSDLYQSLTAETDRIRTDFFDQWYHLGKRTLLDVLSAESDYYNNRVSEVSSRFDGYAAIIRSYASSGTLVNWLNNRSFEN
ncbi:TolC family protein [Pseudomonas chlororaphis]|uniref:TolC family protein n=1 Tax=Pseudomonas chlororaphis TaxID=587753 RepID=UPI0009B8FC86|nr:TolC family protein [Pseudomonas chlororaphis]AZD30812.1 outer membrane efflux protein [Pseudomonas chlororaphis]QFS56161.1 hypothetical protein FD951_17040 [Pseudomonas chlororaphis subsp. aurantiaca]